MNVETYAACNGLSGNSSSSEVNCTRWANEYGLVRYGRPKSQWSPRTAPVMNAIGMPSNSGRARRSVSTSRPLRSPKFRSRRIASGRKASAAAMAREAHVTTLAEKPARPSSATTHKCPIASSSSMIRILFVSMGGGRSANHSSTLAVSGYIGLAKTLGEQDGDLGTLEKRMRPPVIGSGHCRRPRAPGLRTRRTPTSQRARRSIGSVPELALVTL